MIHLLLALLYSFTAKAEDIATVISPSSQNHTHYALTTAIAVPQPLTIGVQVHQDAVPSLDAFLEGGFFKYPLTSSSRSFSDYSFEAGLRYHPFQNWFYTTGEIGFRHIGVTVDISNLKQDGVALANSATLSLGTFFFGLLIGGEWDLSQNISFAFDLGMQFALIHTGGITIQADPSQDPGTDLSVEDAAEMKRISGLMLPQVALARLIFNL